MARRMLAQEKTYDSIRAAFDRTQSAWQFVAKSALYWAGLRSVDRARDTYPLQSYLHQPIQLGDCDNRSVGPCDPDPDPRCWYDPGDCHWRHRYFSWLDHGPYRNINLPDFQWKIVWHPEYRAWYHRCNTNCVNSCRADWCIQRRASYSFQGTTHRCHADHPHYRAGHRRGHGQWIPIRVFKCSYCELAQWQCVRLPPQADHPYGCHRRFFCMADARHLI